jgi:hypothetical protein
MENNNKTFENENNGEHPEPQLMVHSPTGQIFNGSEKLYTFDIYDHVNIQYDICNHGESLKDLQGAYALYNGAGGLRM